MSASKYFLEHNNYKTCTFKEAKRQKEYIYLKNIFYYEFKFLWYFHFYWQLQKLKNIQ